MAQIALEPTTGVPRRLSLRRFVQSEAFRQLGLSARRAASSGIASRLNVP